MNKLTKDDIEFLKDLSKEMKGQDSLATASPRQWVIRDIRDVPTTDEYADGYTLFDEDDCVVLTLEDVNEKLYDILDDEEYQGIKNLFKEQEEDLEFDNLEGWNLDLKLEILKRHGEELSLIPYMEEEFVVESAGSFLTQKAAQNHIKCNSHHYTDRVHTYCIHAWRNPQMKKLIEIIEDTGWDQY